MTICDKMPQGLCASPVIQGKNVGHGEGTTRGAKGTRIITSLVPYVLFVVPPCTSRQTNSLSVQGQYIKRKTSEASLQHSCLSWGRLNEDFVRKSEGRSDCVQIAERFCKFQQSAPLLSRRRGGCAIKRKPRSHISSRRRGGVPRNFLTTPPRPLLLLRRGTWNPYPVLICAQTSFAITANSGY